MIFTVCEAGQEHVAAGRELGVEIFQCGNDIVSEDVRLRHRIESVWISLSEISNQESNENRRVKICNDLPVANIVSNQRIHDQLWLIGFLLTGDSLN